MKLPPDTVIAREKLEDYLLRPREDHDKAGFLALAGYVRDSADRLETDLRPKYCHWTLRTPALPHTDRSS